MQKNSFELAKEIIMLLSDIPGVSGYEHRLTPLLDRIFGIYDVEISSDFIGNYYIQKEGIDSDQKVLLAAHLDEVGLMITYINPKGFLHFTTIGGIDERTLLNQEVIVHGKKDIKGIICSSLSPESLTKNNNSKEFAMDLVIDIGYPREKIKDIVKPGDIVSISRNSFLMLNERITGKALDNRAGIVVLAICFNELINIKHKHRVIAVATVQEEVGLRGAITSSDKIEPSIAVVIDVTHAHTMDTRNQISLNLGNGPAIPMGPNIHPEVLVKLMKTAEENRISYQIQPIAGPTGTDARVIQLASHGIPTGLLSIPLRYMHTSVETASLKDIIDCGKLLAYFIASLPEDLEDLSCS